MSVSMTVHEAGDVLVIDISGRLTVLEENFRPAILQFLKAGHRQFVLKMSDVPYMDSSGLGQLISVYTSIKNMGGSMRLQAPNPRVRELLKITKLDTVFDFVEDGTANVA